jgi:YhcH/YjgK/YiaL family protein
MIVDRFESAEVYEAIYSKLTRGLELLKDKSLAQKPDGKYQAEGDEIYYIVQRYKTKPVEEGKLEAHRKYIDIQFVASGQECFGYAPLKGLREKVAYDDEKDVAFFEVPQNISMTKLSAGMFAVFFPEDVHMPCLRVAGPEAVVKIVVKVKVGE